MQGDSTWPIAIWLVRHGESAGNVARDKATAARLPVIDIATRDCDVPLSPLGERQSAAVGRWFGHLSADRQPTVVLCSPYLRARATAETIRAVAGLELDPGCFVADERLREKEFGILDRLTTFGIRARHPEQAEFRRLLGKFYHRPPGGESWCDVILRLRSVVDTLCLEYPGERVLIVCHQVIVLCFRYLFEQLTEEEILAIDRAEDVANCSVTSYVHDPRRGRRGGMALELFNFVAPLEEAGEPVTRAPDASVAAR